MKIRLLEVGFNKINGFVGDIEFENGVSIEDVTTREANAIASAMRAETFEEDGGPIGGAADVAAKDTKAPVVTPLSRQDDLEEVIVPKGSEVIGVDEVPEDETIHEAVAVESEVESEVEPESEDVSAKGYTFDGLALIADEKGIAGLREIADPLNIKGRSVKDLIDGILNAGVAPNTKMESEG